MIIPSCEVVGEIHAHEGHPGEHGHGGEISEVPEKCAGEASIKWNIEHQEKKNCEEGDRDDVVDDNSSVHVVEVWNYPVDNEHKK